jgi:hypothetical protein
MILNKKIIYLLTVVIFLGSFPLAATDYYVKNGGNDEANGLSDGNAWATVGKVSGSSFSSDDVVQFNKGDTWREKLTITTSHSGTSGHIVTFTSYGAGNKPIISGSDIEASWTQEGSYYYASGYTNNPGVTVKDTVLMKRMEEKVDVDAVDEWWYDAPNDRVYVYFNPSGNTMEISSYSRRWVLYVNSNVQYVEIDGICIRDGCRGVYVFASASDITLQSCTIKNHADWGINISPKTDVLDCDISYIHDGGIKQSGLTSDASGYRIAGNEISWCGYYMCTYCQGSAVIYNHSNIIIEDNEIHHCGLGYTQSWGMDHGLKLSAVGATVRYNNVHDNTAGIGIIVGANNMNVYYNFSWGNGIGISHGYTTTGCKINNNTIYKNHCAHSDTCGFIINDGVVSEFKNNILYLNGNSPYSKQIWFRMGGADDILDCDYNFIYGPADPNNDIIRNVSTGYTWAEWQAAGYDEHSINLSNHGMVDPDNENIHLGSGSPCIGEAIGVGLSLDYYGVSVPQGVYPDIGAAEYESGGGGADHEDFPLSYVDDGCAGTHVGSESNPYDDFADINWTTGGDNSIHDYLAGSPTQSPIVYLKGGDTIREQMTVGCSGTAAYPIIIRMYGSGDAVVNGSDLITTWTEDAGAPEALGELVHSGNGAAEFSIRNSLPADTMTNSGAQIRIEVIANDSVGGTTIVAAFIGEKASSGDVYDMEAGTITEILFSAGSGCALAANEALWSDWLTYSFDKSKDYIISVSTSDEWERRTHTDVPCYYKAGESGESGTANVTGYNTMANRWFHVQDFEVQTPGQENTWKADCTTEPNLVFFDNIKGTKEAAKVGLTVIREWFWDSNVLYVYSTSDPDTAYTDPGIEGGKRDFCIDVNSKDYIIIKRLKLEKANLANVLLDAAHQSDLNYCLIVDGVDGVELDTVASNIQNCVIYSNTNGVDVDAAGYIKNSIVRNNTDDLEETGASINKTTNNIEDDSDANPLMTNPTNGDFTLQSISPCINAGTDVGLTEDYDGDHVPYGSAPDIGAYEPVAGLSIIMNPILSPILSSIIKVIIK